MLDYVIGDSELSDWMRWVAVDKDGGVHGYSHRPDLTIHSSAWDCLRGKSDWIKDIEPPLDFTKCLFEVVK